ncbi:hypothetical protein PHSY_002473 [Pseudozyma hubeiensis SY62]|uniref:Uncharacterized protein n=1 Tax=Pseudozyma hubeiensis (strain SY62) TaxID=1305764 RepID=R9PA09_PSEHS|nr:hypothetical protein PHSY_002473 [Pseudozyma hubeiensis SY62]GAC94900.1 hypothetical protein PHSY_002473 [Pseudozyma hubeiensis SY62]
MSQDSRLYPQSHTHVHTQPGERHSVTASQRRRTVLLRCVGRLKKWSAAGRLPELLKNRGSRSQKKHLACGIRVRYSKTLFPAIRQSIPISYAFKSDRITLPRTSVAPTDAIDHGAGQMSTTVHDCTAKSNVQSLR